MAWRLRVRVTDLHVVVAATHVAWVQPTRQAATRSRAREVAVRWFTSVRHHARYEVEWASGVTTSEQDEVWRQMKARSAALWKTRFEVDRGKQDDRGCQAIDANGGFFGPWVP